MWVTYDKSLIQVSGHPIKEKAAPTYREGMKGHDSVMIIPASDVGRILKLTTPEDTIRSSRDFHPDKLLREIVRIIWVIRNILFGEMRN